MASCHQSGFTPKIFPKLDVPYDMTFNPLITYQLRGITFMNFKSRAYVLHLFHQSVPPKCIAVCAIDLNGVLDRIGYPDSVLVGFLEELRLDLRNDPTLLFSKYS